MPQGDCNVSNQVRKRFGDKSKDRINMSQQAWSQNKKIKHRKKRAYNKEKLNLVLKGFSEDETYSEIKAHAGWIVR